MYHLRPRLQERYCGVARPSYLSRRPDGRYYIQLRLGKTAAAIYGRPLFRASLRTSNFQEARRRLVENLEWVMEIVQAPDLEALGEILRHRLGVYVVDGAPGTERRLAERLAFEHQVRNYMARAQERGYPFARQFPLFASAWVDFVDQNKFAEAEFSKGVERRAYETGRADERNYPTKVEAGRPLRPSPRSILCPLSSASCRTRSSSALSRRMPCNPNRPLPPEGKPTGETAKAADRRMSDALTEFLKPVDPKRRHTTKGRYEAEPIARFAIQFLGDPRFCDVKPEDWRRLDEALPDIPKTKNIPAETA